MGAQAPSRAQKLQSSTHLLRNGGDVKDGQIEFRAVGRKLIHLHTFAILALAALVTGCGVGPSPMASDDGAPSLVAAAKPAKGKSKSTLYTNSASGDFTIDGGGSLKVNFPNYGSPDDVRVSKVLFEVAPGKGAAKKGKKGKKGKKAESKSTYITMEVTTGYVLEDISVDFSPDGHTFSPPGKLTISIRWKSKFHLSKAQKKLLTAIAEHIHPDGTVTDASFETTTQGNAFLHITIDVPGFSRYGLR